MKVLGPIPTENSYSLVTKFGRNRTKPAGKSNKTEDGIHFTEKIKLTRKVSNHCTKVGSAEVFV